MVPLDDIISEELRSDIDESIWRQNTINGKVYTLPFHQLQNTLMVNREMMEAAGPGGVYSGGWGGGVLVHGGIPLDLP